MTIRRRHSFVNFLLFITGICSNIFHGTIFCNSLTDTHTYQKSIFCLFRQSYLPTHAHTYGPTFYPYAHIRPVILPFLDSVPLYRREKRLESPSIPYSRRGERDFSRVSPSLLNVSVVVCLSEGRSRFKSPSSPFSFCARCSSN